MDWQGCSQLLGTLSPSDREVHYLQAVVSWQCGDLNNALRHAEAACSGISRANASSCAAEQYLLGQLLVCRAFTSGAIGFQDMDLHNALSCFQKSARHAPQDVSTHSCIAFTCLHLANDGLALQAAERCLSLCSSQGLAEPPHVEWLRSVLACEQRRLELPQQIRQGMLPPGAVQQQVLGWMKAQISQGGSLIWQGSDLITALPILTGHRDKADAVQLLSQYSITPVAQWLSHPELLSTSEPRHAQGGPDPTFSTCSQDIDDCFSDKKVEITQDSCEMAEGITSKRLELMAQLSSPLADFLRLLLGWQLEVEDSTGLGMQRQRRLADVLQCCLISGSGGSGPPEMVKLQLAMLMLSRLTVKTVRVAKYWTQQLFFRGSDGSCISVMAPGIPKLLRSQLATVFRDPSRLPSIAEGQKSHHPSPTAPEDEGNADTSHTGHRPAEPMEATAEDSMHHREKPVRQLDLVASQLPRLAILA
ncbi:hypothetical protein WJX74_005664 [Apatococcus lobatus]|uniref:Uncharacterized protein n=1 Tax=Apatococcus lobatus TaxID=904363 RepID=A0AAW1RHG9_9CHLO